MSITVDNITKNVSIQDNQVIGDGIFDNLMETVTKHIQLEYESGRITSKDYASVYLGIIQSVLQLSTQFALDAPIKEKQLEELQKEIDLKTAQISNINNDTAIKSEQSAKDLLLKQKEIDLKDAQKNDINNNITLKSEQHVKDLLLKEMELALKDAQKGNILKDTELKSVDKEVKLLDKDILYSGEPSLKQELLTAQVDTAKNQANELLKRSDLLDSQKSLTNSQRYTEQFRRRLLLNQARGFVIDAALKYTKQILDAWVVASTEDVASEAIFDDIQVNNLQQILEAVKSLITGVIDG